MMSCDLPVLTVSVIAALTLLGIIVLLAEHMYTAESLTMTFQNLSISIFPLSMTTASGELSIVQFIRTSPPSKILILFDEFSIQEKARW